MNIDNFFYGYAQRADNNLQILADGLAMRKKSIISQLLIGAFVLLVTIYASASTYLWARQARFIFRPQRDITSTPADYQLPYEDIYMAAKNSRGETEHIHAWWIPAEYPGNRYLIYLHGSALNIAANITHARRFQRMGFSVLLLSYRGYGKSEGAFPTETQVYSDAQTAWSYLVEKKGIKPKAIFIYGHSLGGAVAIELAVNHPAAGGLVVEAAFTSISELARAMPKYRIFPIELIVNQRFDSLQKVSRLNVPVLYLHGTADTLVPPEMSSKLYDFTASAKQLKYIPGGGHNNSAAVGGEEYLQAVKVFIEFARESKRDNDSAPEDAS